MLSSTTSVEDKTQVYFLLLANAILVNRDQFKNGQSFDQMLTQFQNYIQSNRDQGISIETSQLQAAFVGQSSITQQQRFAQVKQMLPLP